MTAEAGPRQLRLRELIRQEVDEFLQHEASDPVLQGVRVSVVELAGESARIWFTCPSGADVAAVERALQRATGLLRARVAEGLNLKRTPELRFRYDPAIA